MTASPEGADDDSTPAGTAPASTAVQPTWAPAAKDAIGTALGTSRLWFTMAQGIVTEVYYPRPDIPQLKDLGFIVADRSGFWVEVRRLDRYEVTWAEETLPALTITHRHERFTLVLRVCADPLRDALLVDFSLTADPLLELYMIAAPRLGEDALSNTAACGEWAGRSVLWAEQGPFGLAIAAVDRGGRSALRRRSVGCVGVSDGWQDFAHFGTLRAHYAEAGPGEVALAAQLPRAGTLALGLASSREAAATLALQALGAGFESAWQACIAGWQRWLAAVQWPAALDAQLGAPVALALRRSAVVIKCHADRTFPGAYVASLSIPWGESSSSRGGYHLVWPRDLVETAGALLALGCEDEARQVLVYLAATQHAEGHWSQNQWLGGKPFWQGMQLDETALPVLLASALADRGALGEVDVADMVRRALGFIARQGPSTGQDRWEEDPGVNTFTITVAIAALVEGSRFLEPLAAQCALMLADAWNERIEEWTWVADTALARRLGVPGYYMRIAPEAALTHEAARHEGLLLRNRSQECVVPADEQLAIDCLQLARFGLRSVDDPALRASVTAIDSLLKTDTPSGPVWHRYNGDGYGEHPDGSAFDGSGLGRGWPLLCGERGHIALLAGEDARPYLAAMAAMSGRGGLLPEQVWDSAPIPARGLFPGKPSGSAMPLVWAHAEYIKLAMSALGGAPVDRPARTWDRYRGVRPQPEVALWQPNAPIRELRTGQDLCIMLPAQALVHFGTNGWSGPVDVPTADWVLGHVARLPTAALAAGSTVEFTFHWIASAVWDANTFSVVVRSRD